VDGEYLWARGEMLFFVGLSYEGWGGGGLFER
jgi:hypothetical protein